MARDIVSHFIELDLYDIKLVSMGWGMTPLNALDGENLKHVEILNRILQGPLDRQPDLFVQISVPNEFQPIGKFNIGITAGIETTACSLQWIEGCNRMNEVWTISEHSKRVFEQTVAEFRDQAGNVVKTERVRVPIRVLHNAVHTDVFGVQHKLERSIDDVMLKIKEKFVYLFVGHWLKGDLGHDRKNVGLLIRLFCETFKNTVKSKQPALLLKTSGAGFSVIDREHILKRIKEIRDQVGPNAPNVYLLHGELTESEMNSLYNHPKVKVHISLTHGEGFGRPLLEASLSEKPIIASGWSGHLDFLNTNDALLVGGKLENVHPSAAWDNVILKESMWFMPDPSQAINMMAYAFENYDTLLPGAKKLARENRQKFSYEAIFQKTKELVEQVVPKFAVQVPIKLPNLKKIELPKLKKVNVEENEAVLRDSN
jgi:hypothetical protein